MLKYLCNVLNIVTEFLYELIYKDNRFYYLSLLKNETNGSFSIHGLWPQTDINNYPSYCKKVNFSLDELQPIINDLNTYWYSTEEKNSDFWQHEYEKHGSCMFKNMSEYEYFNTALKLYYNVIKLNLAKKYYNPTTKKCLIPITLDFQIKK